MNIEAFDFERSMCDEALIRTYNRAKDEGYNLGYHQALEIISNIYKITITELLKKIEEYKESQKCKSCRFYGHNISICDGCVDNEHYTS